MANSLQYETKTKPKNKINAINKSQTPDSVKAVRYIRYRLR